MHLYTEANAIAQEAWEESEFNQDDAQEFIYQSCGDYEVCLHHGKAIEFCASVDTSEGELYLECRGGIAPDGDSFGRIACRIAYATLLCASMSCLEEIVAEHEES